ncbi:MAG: peptidylprolyl isomerase [Phycisphaerales bacterium]
MKTFLLASLLVTTTALAQGTPSQGTPPAAPPAAPAAPAAKPAPAADAPKFVLIEVTHGDKAGEILLQLDPAKAPISVSNFMEYVKSGFYNGTVIHRAIPGFVIQGGGFDTSFVQKDTRAPIKNEWSNGLKNARGTISMARLPSPDSATSQFFLNLKDNAPLDGMNGQPGYAVFGKVVKGMEVVDAIAAIPTTEKQVTVSTGQAAMFRDVPAEVVTFTKVVEITPEAAASKMGTAAPAGGAPAGGAPAGGAPAGGAGKAPAGSGSAAPAGK